jgi:hypothetical protein
MPVSASHSYGNKRCYFLLGILPFPSPLSPQEKHLLTCRRRSEPPWSRPQLRHTVDRPHLSRRPHLPSHLVRQALRSHTVCLVQVPVLHSLTPLYRLWVWGQGALTLLCKVNLGAFLSLLMLFLTLEVISLLRPLRLVVCISSPPGSLHTRVHLEPGVKEHLCKLCQVGSSPFVWNGTFGNNTFASTAFPSGGTPIFGQSTPAQGTIPASGAHIPGPWNSGQGSIPSSGMSFWGNSFHSQWNPRQTSMPLPSGLAWGNPSQSLSNMMNAQHPMSFMGNQPMMSPQMQNPYAGQGHGFYQNPGQQPNFSWQPGASQTPGPFFPGYQQQPKLPFLATLHLPDLTRLLNDPICHDPRWPPMPTKLPSDIPKFEAKPNKDPGDHMITFHLWCSSNSLKDDSVQLLLFQRTLIGSAAKWYIELDHS